MAKTSPIEADLDIVELAPGGAGLGFLDQSGRRRAVFVPGTAPGDRVRARIQLSGAALRGQVLRVLQPGQARETPRCTIAERCGGCDWMHVTEAVRHQAYLAHVQAAMPPTLRSLSVSFVPSPESLAYRTRARLHVHATKRTTIVGYCQAHSHIVVEPTACLVLHPELERARTVLRDVLTGSCGDGEVLLGLGAPNLSSRKAVLSLRWSGDLAPRAFQALEQATAASGPLAGAALALDDAKQSLRFGDPTPWTLGADGRPLELAPSGFAQSSEANNTLLGRHVVHLAQQAMRTKKASVVELYSGAGNFSVALASMTDHVSAVEVDAAACEAAHRNLRARNLRAKIVCADVDAYAIPRGTDLVVLDPPRPGAIAVMRRLADARVRSVIYVSCNSSTLGRDLAALLAAGFQCRSLTAFEMFPQTSHVETVAWLEHTV